MVSIPRASGRLERNFYANIKAGHGQVKSKTGTLEGSFSHSLFLSSFLPFFLAVVHPPLYTASMHYVYNKEMPICPSVLLESKINGGKGAGMCGNAIGSL